MRRPTGCAAREQRDVPAVRDLFAETLTAAGTVVRDDVLLRNVKAQIHNPDVVYNEAEDRFFVAYDSDTNRNLYGFGFDGGVTGLTTPVVTIADGPGRQELPAVAWNSAANQYLVVFESDQRKSGDDDIAGQRVSASGSLVGARIVIATQVRDEQEPDVAYSTTCNSYVATWGWKTPDGDWDVMAQEMEADGTLAGSNFRPGVDRPSLPRAARADHGHRRASRRAPARGDGGGRHRRVGRHRPDRLPGVHRGPVVEVGNRGPRRHGLPLACRRPWRCSSPYAHTPTSCP